MKPKQQLIVNDAMEWIDTPFRPNAKLKGVGTDCIGLIAGAFEAGGINMTYRSDYSVRPDGTLVAELSRRFVRVRDKTIEPCDIILMAFDKEPHHIAMYMGDGYLIHAYAQARRVVYQKYDDYWRSVTRVRYRHPSFLE